MKINKIINISILALVAISCSPSIRENNATVHFKYNEHDFGKLPYKKKNEFTFQFTNTGHPPLIILDVKTSCGCTIADWTKKPIKPGKSGEILVTYDAAFPGTFHKEISVFYNGKDSPANLEIKGQVEYPKDFEETIK